MAKGDDAVRRKKNKKNRKKQQQQNEDSSKVSYRVASIIAAKKRRKSGTRRLCQGMCFSLPTPEDPFNDRQGKRDPDAKEIKRIVTAKSGGRLSSKKNGVSLKKGSRADVDSQKKKSEKVKGLKNEHIISFGSMDKGKDGAQHGRFFELGCPSKFLILCLNTIQNALKHDEAFSCEEEKPLFSDPWGVEFWKHYSVGNDVLETSGACSTTEQIAWIASSAADTIIEKEKEGLLFTNPFLLFLVPSQEKATKARSICKPLKALGIHTVCLHPGASIDHQIQGLKSCDPEFLISTPGRLLELISLKAVDISGVSSLVVDGMATFVKEGCTDVVGSIRQAVSGNPHMVVFNDCSDYTSTLAVRNLLQQSICRLSINNSIASQSACILQSVDVCISKEERVLKAIKFLNHLTSNQSGVRRHCKVLFLIDKDSETHELVSGIKSKGYFISADPNSSNAELKMSNNGPSVFVFHKKKLSSADVINQFEAVVLFNFVLSVEDYVEILTRMARSTVHGMLHSLLGSEDASLAGPLIKILQQCGQDVPAALTNLYDSSLMSED